MTRLSNVIGRVLLGLSIVAGLLGATPASVAAGTGTTVSVSVAGSPFYPNGDGKREKVTVSVSLSAAAYAQVDVLDFDGALVKALLPSQARAPGRLTVKWNGRDDAGVIVPDGPYMFRAMATPTSGGSAETVEAWFTKARQVIYKQRSSAILVAIDPGHGDVYSEPGRYAPDGTHESVINLDIGLRLRAMLEGAGVRTVVTRETPSPVNVPEWDRTGDGVVGYGDELEARCDGANEARADVFISIHNNLANSPKISGPATYYRPDRTFGSASLVLANAVQKSMLARLDLYATDTWHASRSHGVLSHYPYYVLSSYAVPDRPRPTLMPGVLSEGMFLTNPTELALLQTPRVRQSMAAAYYDAIQTFVAKRAYAVGFEAVSAPAAATEGESVAYLVEMTNKGQYAASSWTLESGLVPAVPLYDGTGARGELLGSVAIPTLVRGGATTLDLEFAAPPPGEWLIKFDVRLPDGTYLSDRGSPPLQLPLSVAAPT
ncbi:MAG: N-acetylmuramoyl-L-alanine amidase [Candidatus Limnocylindrales bacterium]